jgi:Mn2+/Fe2+ NRAMP family transporter
MRYSAPRVGLNFQRLPPYRTAPLPPFRGWWAGLGPGIVWMALAQGSGELIWWPYLCAKYGLGFLFLLAPACLLQYAVTFEIGRYTAFTGESIWRGFIRLHPIFAFALWILMIVSFLWFGAFASAGGTALAALLPWPAGWEARDRSLAWAALTIAGFAFALLTRRRTYRLIEHVMWAVAISTLVGLVVACSHPTLRSAWPPFLRAVVLPAPLARPWDPADADRLLTAATFAGLGGFWILFYSYWLLGKQVAFAGGPVGVIPDGATDAIVSRGQAWRRLLVVDSGLGVVGNLLTTLMTCFLAYAILHPQGILPEEWRLAVEQARFFELQWGAIGRALFLIVAAAFLCDTWLSTADAVARVHLEMIHHYFAPARAWNERRAYQVMILILTAVTGITMFLRQPGQLIVLSALIGFIGTVVFTFAIVRLVHGPFKQAMPLPLRPGRLSLALLLVSATAYAALALAYLWVRLR